MMKRNRVCFVAGIVLLQLPLFATADADKEDPKAALRAFNDLIGVWRGTGTPEGTREEKQRGFWTETLKWSWQFKANDVALVVAFTKGKYFTSGQLRYLPEKSTYELSLTTPSKEQMVFSGQLKGRTLTLDRNHAQETQRLIITLLHANRFLYSYELKPAGRTRFARVYQVGATKEGVAFASGGSSAPECIVTGGLGKIQVSYKGKNYHVCCDGCREAFLENPEKCIQEAAQRKKKESGEKMP
jgi:YHS domain-containing protein